MLVISLTVFLSPLFICQNAFVCIAEPWFTLVWVSLKRFPLNGSANTKLKLALGYGQLGPGFRSCLQTQSLALLPWPLSWFTSLFGRFSSKMWPLSKFRLTYPELLWLAENYLPCISLNGSSFKSLSLCLGEMLIPIPVSVARGRGFPDQSLSHDVPSPELTQEKNQSQSFPMFWGWEGS